MLLESPEEDIRDDKGVWKLQRRSYKDGYTQLIVSQMEWKVFYCTPEELVSYSFPSTFIGLKESAFCAIRMGCVIVPVVIKQMIHYFSKTEYRQK